MGMNWNNTTFAFLFCIIFGTDVSSENEVTTVPLLVSVVELPEDELPEPDEAELST